MHGGAWVGRKATGFEGLGRPRPTTSYGGGAGALASRRLPIRALLSTIPPAGRSRFPHASAPAPLPAPSPVVVAPLFPVLSKTDTGPGCRDSPGPEGAGSCLQRTECRSHFESGCP